MSFSLKDIVSGGALPDSPEGGYLVKFDDLVGEMYQPKTGEPKPRVKFKGHVVSGELTDRKFFFDRYLTAAALGILKSDLLGAGLDGEYEFTYSPLEDWKGFTRELRGIFLGGKLFYLEAKLGKAKGQYAAKTEYRVIETYGTVEDEMALVEAMDGDIESENGVQETDEGEAYDTV